MNYSKENEDWHTWLEKPVCVKNKLFGTLKYFGKTKFCDGLWGGIELDEPLGKNNGTVDKVKYFTCLPNFGLFVRMSQVRKIEPNPKDTCDPNETYKVQGSHATTILIATSDNGNIGNTEIGEIKKDETETVGQDSDESLGLLDPCLIESLSQWNLSNIAALGNDPDLQDTSFELDSPELCLAEPHLPTSNDVFPDEISYPKYASTPRVTVKNMLTPFTTRAEIGSPLQDAHEDVIFDSEKFKKNPDLASTSKFQNSLSPIKCDNTPQLTELNKTRIIPITNQEIVLPVLMDLNTMPTAMNSAEIKDLNLTVCLTSKGLENSKKTSHVDTPVDIPLCKIVDLTTINLDGSKLAGAATQKVPNDVPALSESDVNIQGSTKIFLPKNLDIHSSDTHISEIKGKSLLQKTDFKQNMKQVKSEDDLSKNGPFESFDYKEKFLKEAAILEKSLSVENARNTSIPVKSHPNINNASIRTRNQKIFSSLKHKINKEKVTEFKKPLSRYSSIHRKVPLQNSTGTGAIKNSSNSKESITVLSDITFVNNVNPESSTSSANEKLKQENRAVSLPEKEFLLPTKSRISFLKSKRDMSSSDIESKKVRLSSSHDLDLIHNRPSKNLNLSSSFSSKSTSTIKNEKVGVLTKNSLSRLSVQSRPFSNEPGIPSFSPKSRKTVPVCIIKPRSSMLLSSEESGHLNQLDKSPNSFILRAVKRADSIKTSKIAVSLPQKSQIATSKEQKYSEVKKDIDGKSKLALVPTGGAVVVSSGGPAGSSRGPAGGCRGPSGGAAAGGASVKALPKIPTPCYNLRSKR